MRSTGSRLLADGLLAVMAAGYVVGLLLPADFAGSGALSAFCGAGLIGGLADWFAVTALFRHPLGLPIPHTAIVPRNQQRLGRALGDFIAGNFLEPRLLDTRVAAARPGAMLAGWLSNEDHVAALAAGLGALAPEAARAAPTLGDLGVALARRLGNASPLSPVLARLLEYLWREAHGQALVDQLIDVIAGYLAAHPEVIEEGVRARTWAWLPRWADKLMAERLADGLLVTAREAKSPDHPIRLSLSAAVETWIERLRSDPATMAAVERVKHRLLADPDFTAAIRREWEAMLARLTTDPQALRGGIERISRRALGKAGAWLAQDTVAQERIDRLARVAVRRVLSPARVAIGDFVAQVVAGWDADDAARRLEAQVGRDLQYIRVNGALVGALAGLLIWALTRLVR